MKIALATVWVAACLAFFLTRADAFIGANSATFDEAVHLSAGYSYWARGDFRLNHETPPLSKLIAALPLYVFRHPKFEPPPEQWADSSIWQVGNDFLFRNTLPPQEMLAWGRWATVPEGAALILLIGWWAYRRFGYYSGLFAVTLASLEPNLLAFSCIVNSDMALTLLTFASAYTSWEYFQSRRKVWFVLTGIAIGLSLASKFSALFFVPGLLLCWLLLLKENRVNALFRLVLTASVTIAACYFLVGFPHFGMGLKQQMSRNDFDPPEFYLLGEVSNSGWWYYFPVIVWYKSVSIWIFLLCASLLLNILQMLDLGESNRRPDIIFLVPALVFFLAMSALKVDLGIRVILPLSGFVLVWMGGAVRFSTRSQLLFVLSICSVVILAGGIPQVLICRTRELTFFYRGAPEARAARIFGDSNLDWGQDLLRLKWWVDRPKAGPIYLAYTGSAPAEAYGIAFVPLPAWGRVEPYPPLPAGKPDFVAVSVSCLQGLHLKERGTYKFLERIEPVSRLGGAIWIYDMRDRPDIRGEVERLAERLKNGHGH